MAVDRYTLPLNFGVSLGGKDVVVPPRNEFDELVSGLKEALGPSSGLTCDDIDVGFLSDLMQHYDSSDNQWARYAFGDRSRGYTRNLVDEGNGKSNLV
jgi:cysteine dioxygenase